MTKIDPLLKKTLELIAAKGWLNFSLSDIADDKDITLAKVHAKYPNRLCLIEEFSRYIDQMTLENLEKFDETEAPPDRLFSTIMTRFDSLEPYKALIRSLWHDGWKDPMLLIGSLPIGLNSMSWILQAARIDTTGLRGALRIKIFTAFYLCLVWTWLNDSSETLDETMVLLDNSLKRLSQVPGFFLER